MTNEIFDKAVEFTLEHEGYRSYDKAGGPTIFGIASTYHKDLVDRMDKMSKEDARIAAIECYYKEYWRPASCDDFGKCTATVMLDSAVNPGLHAAIKCLQRAINVEDDGVIGSKTIKAAESLSDLHIAMLMIGQRRKYYQDKVIETPAKIKYLKGWLNRCDDLEKFIREI